mmetsp:Transcript_15807/g.26497  ORF Transcript_15807/g.26497 Transcript_15807/m.26497 type:complete len:651 (+) Transcript_15807:1118-3070(+)
MTKDAMTKSRDDMYTKLKDKYGRDPRQLLPLGVVASQDNDNNNNAPPNSMFLLDDATQTAIQQLLNAHVLDEQHVKEMEEIFESNLMLGQMEMMNAEMFAQMTSDALEAMQGNSEHDDSSSDHSRRRNVVVQSNNNDDDDDGVEFHEDDEMMEEQTKGDSSPIVASKEQQQEEPLETTTASTPVLEASTSNSDDELHPKESDDETKTSTTTNGEASTQSREEEMPTTTTNVDVVTSGEKEEDHDDSEEPVKESTTPSTAAINTVDATDLPNEDTATPSADQTIEAQPLLVAASSSGSIVSDTNAPSNNRDDTSPPIVVDTLGDQETSSHSATSPSSKARNVTRNQANKMDHSLLVWDWEANYSGELYTVTWETEFLIQLCRVVEVLFMEVGSQVSKEVLKQTLIGGMVSAVAIPSALTTAIGVIDDPYQLISIRSDKAGAELAQCLLQSDEHRPVSLVGFSFGARVIFSCLLELARHQTIWEEQEAQPKEDASTNETAATEKKTRARRAMAWVSRKARRKKDAVYVEYKREPASIVEDVVLIGLPMRIDRKEWIACRELIAGRLVNCYNKSDWVLSYMINIRCWNGVNKACGTHPIQQIKGIENYEVSHLASRHDRYPLAVPHILHEVGYGEPWHKAKKVDQGMKKESPS